MNDSKKLKLLGNLGVGGGTRRCVLDKRSLPFSICNTIQGCYKNHPINLGNINQGGIGQFGCVYHENGLAPTIAAGTHGYCVGHILVTVNDNRNILQESSNTDL